MSDLVEFWAASERKTEVHSVDSGGYAVTITAHGFGPDARAGFVLTFDGTGDVDRERTTRDRVRAAGMNLGYRWPSAVSVMVARDDGTPVRSAAVEQTFAQTRPNGQVTAGNLTTVT